MIVKPIEHELVCPACRGPLAAVYPPLCTACGWFGFATSLVLSTRTRMRQFPIGRYPAAAPFTPTTVADKERSHG